MHFDISLDDLDLHSSMRKKNSVHFFLANISIELDETHHSLLVVDAHAKSKGENSADVII